MRLGLACAKFIVFVACQFCRFRALATCAPSRFGRCLRGGVVVKELDDDDPAFSDVHASRWP